MKMAALYSIAKEKGVKTRFGMPKGDLIHDIQRAEGNTPCFGMANGKCDQHLCAWRTDCLGLAALTSASANTAATAAAR